MNEEQFNKWWDSDGLMLDNPYREDSPAFWAWEGWVAGVRAEREACAKVCEELFQPTPPYMIYAEAAQDCAAAIRARRV